MIHIVFNEADVKVLNEAIAMDAAASLGRTHRVAGSDVLVQFSDGVLLAR